MSYRGVLFVFVFVGRGRVGGVGNAIVVYQVWGLGERC